jgi:hypothetical protein
LDGAINKQNKRLKKLGRCKSTFSNVERV